MRRILRTLLLLTLLLSMLSACANGSSLRWDEDTEATYNETPELESKLLIDDQRLVETMPRGSFATLLKFTDIIVVGTIRPDDMDDTSDYPWVSVVDVEHTLYGTVPSDEIELLQFYNPVSDPRMMEYYGNRALFFLSSSEVNQYLMPLSDSIFYINDDRTVLTTSRNRHLAKYDHADLDLLLRDLNEALLKKHHVPLNQ